MVELECASRPHLPPMKCALIADEHPQELLDIIDVMTNQTVRGENPKAQVPCASRILFASAF